MRTIVLAVVALVAACGSKEPSCEQLIAHEKKVVLATSDALAPPTVKEQAARDMASRVSTCKGMRFSREQRDCYMKADSMEAMRACSGGQHLYPGGLFIFN